MASSASIPVLAYDGNCALCTRLAALGRRLSRGRVEFRPNSAVSAEHPEIPSVLFDQSVVLIESDGAVSIGALAVWKTLAYGGGPQRFPLWCYRHMPGFAAASEALYRLVARNHHTISCSRDD